MKIFSDEVIINIIKITGEYTPFIIIATLIFLIGVFIMLGKSKVMNQILSTIISLLLIFVFLTLMNNIKDYTFSISKEKTFQKNVTEIKINGENYENKIPIKIILPEGFEAIYKEKRNINEYGYIDTKISKTLIIKKINNPNNFISDGISKLNKQYKNIIQKSISNFHDNNSSKIKE